MYCPECGTKNPEENSFCSSCNAALIDNSPQSTVQTDNPIQGGYTPPHTPTGYAQPLSAQPANKATEPPITIDFNAAAEKLKNIDVKKTASDIGEKVKKVNKKTKIVLASITGVLAAIIAFGCIGSSIYNPEKVAKKYFESYIEGDYYEMFDCMMVEDSEFMTEENFYNYMVEQYGYNDSEIIDYDIYESSGYGEYDDYSASSDTPFNKTYVISYMLKGESYSNTFTVNLALADSGKLLFFDEYMVVADQYLVKNYTIYTVKDARVSIDGVDLEKSETDISDYEDYYSNFDAYVIDSIFGSEHSLTIESDCFDTYTSEIYISSGYSDVYEDLTLSSATEDVLVQKCKDVFTAFSSAAQSGNSFPSDVAKFTDDYSYLSNIQESYDELCNEFATSSSSGYISVTPGDFYYSDFEYDDGIFTIRSEFSFDYTYRSYGWWSSDFTDSQSSDYGYVTLSLENIDGEWVVISFYYSGL